MRLEVRPLVRVQRAAINWHIDLVWALRAQAGEVVLVDEVRRALELRNELLVPRDVDALEADAGELGCEEICLCGHGAADGEQQRDVLALDEVEGLCGAEGPEPEVGEDLLGFSAGLVFPVLEGGGEDAAARGDYHVFERGLGVGAIELSGLGVERGWGYQNAGRGGEPGGVDIVGLVG